MWSTALGFALPFIGADADVLATAGYSLVPQTCGTVSDGERSATYAFGFSNTIYGEILILAHTEDDVLQQINVLTGELAFEGDPLRSDVPVCLDEPPPPARFENALGVTVETRVCPRGTAVIERATTGLGSSDLCSLFDLFTDQPLLSLFLR